ncbi:MAG: hypothetical protein ABI594_12990 [Ginsengibacter sp.]
MIKDEEVMHSFDKWVKEFSAFVKDKGKVEPGKYRAFGYKQPPHLWNEIKTGIRSWKLRFGKAPKNSSPWMQEKYGLNKDITLHPKKSEGEKLRD